MSTQTPKSMLVSAAVIFERSDGEKFLIAKRRKNDRIEAGKWEFPGGKVEFGEHPEACLIREIKEELNLDVEVTGFLDIASHVYPVHPPLHVILVCYLCRLTGGELKHLAVADAKWITTKEIGHYEFAVADLPLVESLRKKS